MESPRGDRRCSPPDTERPGQGQTVNGAELLAFELTQIKFDDPPGPLGSAYIR